MRITRDEFERSTERPALELFWQGIKAEETRDKYTRTLRRILCDILGDFLDGTFEQRAAQIVRLAKEDPQWIMDILLTLSKKLRERTTLDRNDPYYLNPSSIDNYFKPIRKLLDMNDVTISWKRIHTTFPEVDNISQTREWKREEIQTMLKFANGSIDRAIVLIAASSGIRSGAFKLHWQDITPIYKVGDSLKMDTDESDDAKIVCAMIMVYRGTSAQYPAFITAEAYGALMDYKKEWQNKIKRMPNPDDPIFLKEGPLVRMASINAIKRRVERMIQRAGLRGKLDVGQKRHEVPIMNGFRRFFNKTIKHELSNDSPLASLIKKEYMMGHTGLVKLDRNYFKTNVLELAQEYIQASDTLVISDENKLKIENKNLKNAKDDLEDTSLIKQMQKRIEELEYGKEARESVFAKMTMHSQQEWQRVLSPLLEFMFEMGNDEEFKRRFWKEIKDAQRENRPVNRTVLDPNYEEPTETEKQEMQKYVQERLQELEKRKPYPKTTEPVKITDGKLDVQNPPFNEERALKLLLE